MRGTDRIYASGMVRRIDEVGRVVIPAEMREVLGWKTGDPVELFCDRQGHVILRKYSPIAGLEGVGTLCVRSLAETLKAQVMLTDTDIVVAVAGYPASAIGRVPPEIVTKAIEKVEVQFNQESIAVPILRSGNVIGAIEAHFKSPQKEIKEKYLLPLRVAANFLGQYLSE